MQQRPRSHPPLSEEEVLAAVQALLADAHRAGRRARLFSYAVRHVPVGLHFVPELTLTVRLEIDHHPARTAPPAVTITEDPA